MSLLAAFAGMLGKQWVSRYLRHAGGSVMERCGDRQRKFDGLEKWPFRLFIEGLPILLQIALLLLACGLSRYVWSIDASIARVITSFAILGVLFYIGLVVAGTSSYECPFQTPASIALRSIRDSETTRKVLSILSPFNVRRNARKLLASLSPPNTTSLVYAAWIDARQGLVSVSCRVYDIMRSPSTWKVSPSGILSSICRTGRKVGRRAIVPLRRLNQVLGKAKHGLVQVIQRLSRAAALLPVTRGTHGQASTSHNGSRLLARARTDLEKIRKWNRADARCVYWILRNITDPEAVDSAIRLAVTIQWFDGDFDYSELFKLITDTFHGCFDSTKQLYPGTKDRAYSSARAILRINRSARVQSLERASKYPIPALSSSSYPRVDPDLYDVIRMLESNFHRPTLDFPGARAGNNSHLLWMSNLFVEVTRVGPNPTLKSYRSYLSAAITNNQAIIANILLVWYMFLGGEVEEETFWANDRSYVVVSLSFLSTCLKLCAPAIHWKSSSLIYLKE